MTVVSILDTLLSTVRKRQAGAHRPNCRGMSTFGQRLRQARAIRLLSQEQLGLELGVTKAAVSKWETDLTEPDMESLVKLCEVLRYPLEDLVVGPASKNQAYARNVMRIMDGGSGAHPPYDILTATGRDEKELLLRYRNATPRKRAAVIELLVPDEQKSTKEK